MFFSELLQSAGIDPAAVLVFRHAPKEKLTTLRGLAENKPKVFNAYQQTQLKGPEKELNNPRYQYVASFVGRGPGHRNTAEFVGLYRKRGARPLTREEYRAHRELGDLIDEHELLSEENIREGHLWFELQQIPFLPKLELPFRLIIDWPFKVATRYWCSASKAMPILAPEELLIRTSQASGGSTPDNPSDAGVLVGSQAKNESQLSESGGESFRLPEEIDVEGLSEGAVRSITVNAYERNPEARTRCLRHYGYDCSVCGFNFLGTYGSIGENYIHVHHLRELSQVRAEYSVDPIRDLRPVCPNCHAMLHTKRPALSIDALKAMLKSRSNDARSRAPGDWPEIDLKP